MQLFISTVEIKRAEMIGMANLVYNIRRFIPREHQPHLKWGIQ